MPAEQAERASSVRPVGLYKSTMKLAPDRYTDERDREGEVPFLMYLRIIPCPLLDMLVLADKSYYNMVYF